MKLNRILSAALAAVLTASCAASFTGCKKKQTVEKTIVDHVYRSTIVNLPEELNYVQQMFASGDKIILTGNYYDQTTYRSEKRVYSMNPDGTGLTRTELPGLTDPEGSYTQQLLCAPDGSIWKTVYSSSYNEETGEYSEAYTLKHIAADGSELCSVNGTSFWGEDTGDEDNRVYHYMEQLKLFGDGVLFMDNGTIYLTGADGSVAGKVDISELNESGYVQSIFTADGSLTLLHSDYSGATQKMTLIPVDVGTGKLGTPSELDSLTFRNVWNYFEGAGYSFYYNDEKGVYGYDAATNTSELLLDFLNSDISSNSVNNMVVLSADKFVSSGWDNVTGNQVISILDRVPEDQVVPKYLMTIATLGDAWSLRNNVIRFNRQSDEYRFQIQTYSPDQYYANDGSDYDYEALVSAALNALNNDIIAGKVPDVLVVNERMPIESYIAKGLFADLYPFIDADERMERSDFLTNILDAYAVGGKLYEITPTVQVRTLAGKKEMLGDRTGWTMAEFMEWSKTIPEDARVFYDMTRDQLLSMFCTYAYEEFVDPETGKCSFDSDEFKKILEYVKTLSNESIWDTMGESYDQEFWENYENRFRDNRAMLEEVYLYSFYSYRSLMNYTFYTDQITLVGLPSSDRSGSVIATGDMSFAISAKSPMIDGAWAFVSYFLTEEYQDSITNSFPLRVSSLEKMADTTVKESMEDKKNREEQQKENGGSAGVPETMPLVTEPAAEEPAAEEEVDENGDGVIDDADAAPAVSVDVGIMAPVYEDDSEYFYLDREKADELLAFLKTLNHVVRNNSSVNSIIEEEAGAYFAGQKSLDETAKIIQNRVFTYVSERR